MINYLMKYLLIYIFLFVSFPATSQVIMNKDSLLTLLPSIKEDSAGVEFYINLGQQYENSETELAKHYYRLAGSIGEKIDYQPGVVRYIFNYTFLLNMQGSYDSGLILNRKAVEIARRLNDSLLIGKALFNVGTSYRYLSQYEKAIPIYEEGRRIIARFGDSLLMAHGYDILQLLYFYLENYDQAIAYGEMAVKLLRTVDDPIWLGTALSNLGLSYSKKREYARAQEVWIEALAIGRKIGNLEIEATPTLNLGDLAMNTGNYNALGNYFRRSLALYTKLDNIGGIVISLRGLALDEFYKRNFEAARDYGIKSLKLANDNNLVYDKMKTLETLSDIYIALHDLETAQKYLRQGHIISDSIVNERIKKVSIEAEIKYESEKKDIQIKLQRSVIKQKNTLSYILIGGAASLLVISLLSYFNYQNKQKIQLQRISELEKEKQLSATEAVLKGEEQERTRLAKDLHDGLGGMLSGIKYSLNTMKGNMIMTPDNAQAFERSIEMLDSSIQEMRRVAHNMMPEVLVKFGLDAALKDFCNGISQTGALNVQYQSLKMKEADIDQTTSITLYRVVQELVNNALKHASAKNVIVQISRTEGGLTLEVEDDGIGFDTEILRATAGIGWNNIKNRVEFLKGKLDVSSQTGRGTSVHIELDI